jgi:hypothetical protein
MVVGGTPSGCRFDVLWAMLSEWLGLYGCAFIVSMRNELCSKREEKYAIYSKSDCGRSWYCRKFEPSRCLKQPIASEMAPFDIILLPCLLDLRLE